MMTMPRSSSVIDWESLKPEILRLLSAGKTQKDVREELSRGGPSITKSQLEYQLKCWGQRTRLTEQAWRFAGHRIEKRGRKSAVFFNGALIPDTKVTKEISRHVRPTMLPGPGDSPTCPPGFDLVICTPASLADSPSRNALSQLQQSLPNHEVSSSSLPWVKLFRELQGGLGSASLGIKEDMIDWTSFAFPAASQFPGTLVRMRGMRKTLLGLQQLGKPSMVLLGWTDDDQAVTGETVRRQFVPFESQIAILIGLQMFQISNKLFTGSGFNDDEQLRMLGNTVKLVAKTTSNWKDLLTAGTEATSRALIEQLFALSITVRDEILAELMLQIGADPNQHVFDRKLEMCVSALDYTIRYKIKSLTNILLDAGAAFGQISLKQAIMAGDLNTASHILRSGQSLDLDFNYLSSLHPSTASALGRLKLEKATLLGLVCFGTLDWKCYCNSFTVTSNHGQSFLCQRCTSIDCLEFLIQEGATINPDTMILASFNADVVPLRFLMQHGGKVDRHNIFGFSCLDAASLGERLQYEVFSLLLASGATTGNKRTHNALDSRASLLHQLLLSGGARYKFAVDQLIESGADINHRIRHIGSAAELTLAHEKFLLSQSTQHATYADLIAHSKAESPLEYAIIGRYKVIALRLILLGCHLTGREIPLAVKMGSMSTLKGLIECDRSNFDQESIRKISLRLALRCGYETIVQYLLRKGTEFGGYDIMDAVQYPGMSVFSTNTQIKLIHATPELDRLQIFGRSLLELCCLKFKPDAVRLILTKFPAAFDSGALSAIAIRALRHEGLEHSDIMTMASRRTGDKRDWEKENAAVFFAAMQPMFGPFMLSTPSAFKLGTACAIKTARIPRQYFSSAFDPLQSATFHLMDPTQSLGSQDWVSCSPVIGISLAPLGEFAWVNYAKIMLDQMLGWSYEPDALTVVIAAARGQRYLLERFQCLDNWQSILSIDDDRRPLWCPTALQAATLHGDEEMVKFLLEAGTSVNEASAEEPIGNLLPRTALQAAVDKGNLKLTNLFIKRGASINAPAAERSGATALQLACIHGHLTISLRLLELGADVNARGAKKNGRTPLEGAAEYGRIDTIQLLLSHGVCTDGPYREQYLKSVLYAQKNQHFAAAALLKEHREWSAEDEECYKKLQSAGLADT